MGGDGSQPGFHREAATGLPSSRPLHQGPCQERYARQRCPPDPRGPLSPAFRDLAGASGRVPRSAPNGGGAVQNEWTELREGTRGLRFALGRQGESR